MTAAAIQHRPPKAWLKISIRVDPRMTEAITARLADLAPAGLEISVPGDEPAGTDHPYAAETVTAYFPMAPGASGNVAAQNTAALRQFLEKVERIFPGCPAPVLLTETIVEEDWGEKWKSFFTSFQATPRLMIKPSWEGDAGRKRQEGPDTFVIEMDPGLAFGTGHHASTQLALLLLDAVYLEKGGSLERVLDVGTGSGILAMACGLFGAREVLALDQDPDAVATAKQNVVTNRLADRITVSRRDVASVQGRFDLVAANITHDILADLAETLTGLINPQGYLVLAGILRGGQERSITGIYARNGLELVRNQARDEWAALLFHKER